MVTKSTALLLARFLGGFGAHHFYLGNSSAGWLSVIFFWTLIPTFVAFVNIIQLACMSTEQFDEKYNGGNERANEEKELKKYMYEKMMQEKYGNK